MRCALEAIAIAKVNAVRVAEEKRLEEERRRKRIILNTEKKFKEIEEAIENQIHAGKSAEWKSELFGKNYYETLAFELEYDGMQYANKELSRRRKPDYDGFDYSLLAEMLAPYCYIVEEKESSYQRYGFGHKLGIYLTVKPNPECLK